MRGVVLGGAASGVGKTVATLVVARALSNAGYEVQTAKAGPDFIDPSHHALVSSSPSRTLDPWLQGEDGMRRTYARGRGDVCVVEGMMGLYDGDVASTASVAAALELPVVLVVDASAGMQSVCATALGFREYAVHAGIEIDVVGVVAQRAHGGRHEAGIRDSLPDGIRYVGRVPPNEGLEIPDRHLGLHLGDEAPIDTDALDAAAEAIDAAAIADLARAPATSPPPETPAHDRGVRIAVARDAAFAFCYPSTFDRLRELGNVVSFSPVADDPLPDCDGVYLPGGYPELHGAALAESRALETLADRAADGLPVFGECGGFMALAESLTTADGDTYEMAGVLPGDTRMRDRYQALDHVELRANRSGPTASAGETRRGHEFHYSSHDGATDATYAFDVERGRGIDGDHDGLTEYETVGTYAHVHPESGAFDRFAERCAAAATRRR
ncbi:cobyrinic acid a,c-diamide synthase [Haloferacaceae archaeon DSL9]